MHFHLYKSSSELLNLLYVIINYATVRDVWLFFGVKMVIEPGF